MCTYPTTSLYGIAQGQVEHVPEQVFFDVCGLKYLSSKCILGVVKYRYRMTYTLLKISSIRTYKWLKEDTVPTYKWLKVGTIPTYKWM